MWVAFVLLSVAVVLTLCIIIDLIHGNKQLVKKCRNALHDSEAKQKTIEANAKRIVELKNFLGEEMDRLTARETEIKQLKNDLQDQAVLSSMTIQELQTELSRHQAPESYIHLLKVELAEALVNMNKAREGSRVDSERLWALQNEYSWYRNLMRQLFPVENLRVNQVMDEQKKAAAESLEAVRAAGDNAISTQRREGSEDAKEMEAGESVKGEMDEMQDTGSGKDSATAAFEQGRNPTLHIEAAV